MFPRWVNIPGTLTLLACVAAWEGAIQSGLVTFDYLPAPSGILVAFLELVRSGELLTNTTHTLRSIVLGWIAASAIGLALGLIFGLSPLVRRYCLASIEVLRPLPAIAFLPAALLLFSFSLTTELIVIVYAGLWPMFVNTMGGVTSVAGRLHDVSRTLQLSRLRALATVVVPAAAPAILVGLRLSMGTAVVMAIIAEMLGNPHGLGYAVVSALQAMRPERMFAYVLFVGVLAIALNACLVQAERRVLRGYGGGVASHA